MIIIWGTRTKEKIMAIAAPHNCESCNNTVQFQLIRVMRWFTLFWIPIFPFSIKYFLSCPVCNNGWQLKKEQAKAMIADVQSNNLQQ